MEEKETDLDEENQRRVQLGLKPLRKSKRVETSQLVQPESTEPKQSSASLQHRLSQAKARRILEQSSSDLSLGEQLSREDSSLQSTADWTKSFSSKSVDSVNLSKSLNSSASIAADTKKGVNNVYTSKDLSGVVVAHDSSLLESGKETILTLQDTLVLSETSKDVLENTRLAQLKRSLQGKNREKKVLPSKYGQEPEERLEEFVLDSSGGFFSEDVVESIVDRPVPGDIVSVSLSGSKSGSSLDYVQTRPGKRKTPSSPSSSLSLLDKLSASAPDISQQHVDPSNTTNNTRLKKRTARRKRYTQALEEASSLSSILLNKRTPELKVEDPISSGWSSPHAHSSDKDKLAQQLLAHKSKSSSRPAFSDNGTVKQSTTSDPSKEHLLFSRVMDQVHEEVSDRLDSPNTIVRMDVDDSSTSTNIIPESSQSTADINTNANTNNSTEKTFSTHDPVLGRGVGVVLELLRSRGLLEHARNRTISHRILEDSIHLPEPSARKRNVRIEHIDEFGREMSAKEAFKKMGQAFHNKAPGMRKRKKRERQHQREINAHKTKSSLVKLQESAQRAGKAFVDLDEIGRSKQEQPEKRASRNSPDSSNP